MKITSDETLIFIHRVAESWDDSHLVSIIIFSIAVSGQIITERQGKAASKKDKYILKWLLGRRAETVDEEN